MKKLLNILMRLEITRKFGRHEYLNIKRFFKNTFRGEHTSFRSGNLKLETKVD